MGGVRWTQRKTVSIVQGKVEYRDTQMTFSLPETGIVDAAWEGVSLPPNDEVEPSGNVQDYLRKCLGWSPCPPEFSESVQ